MANTTAELTWITFLMRDIGIPIHQPPELFCDNLSALHMSINPVFHARTKHIELDYHFVREKVALGSLITRYVPSSKQLADIFTKPLSKVLHWECTSKLGVRANPHFSLRTDVNNESPHNSQSSNQLAEHFASDIKTNSKENE